MTFCERFHISPLEYDEQPADRVLRWYRFVGIEGGEVKRRQLLAEFRAGRQH